MWKKKEKGVTECKLLVEKCLEYTVYGVLRASRWELITHELEIINTTRAFHVHMDVRHAKKHLWGVLMQVFQKQNFWHCNSAMKSIGLCSQVSSLCRTSLWNNSFTLAAMQYGHNQSCHQPAVQTQPEELYSYKNRGESIQSRNAQSTSPFCTANGVSFVLASTVLRIKVKKICCSYSVVNFHLVCERLRHPALT